MCIYIVYEDECVWNDRDLKHTKDDMISKMLGEIISLTKIREVGLREDWKVVMYLSIVIVSIWWIPFWKNFMHYSILAYSPGLQAVKGTNNVITLTSLCPGFPVLLLVGALTNVSASSTGCPLYVRPGVWYPHWREESSQCTGEVSNVSKKPKNWTKPGPHT